MDGVPAGLLASVMEPSKEVMVAVEATDGFHSADLNLSPLFCDKLQSPSNFSTSSDSCNVGAHVCVSARVSFSPVPITLTAHYNSRGHTEQIPGHLISTTVWPLLSSFYHCHPLCANPSLKPLAALASSLLVDRTPPTPPTLITHTRTHARRPQICKITIRNPLPPASPSIVPSFFVSHTLSHAIQF